jgi:hypothetical protein
MMTLVLGLPTLRACADSGVDQIEGENNPVAKLGSSVVELTRLLVTRTGLVALLASAG